MKITSPILPYLLLICVFHLIFAAPRAPCTGTNEFVHNGYCLSPSTNMRSDKHNAEEGDNICKIYYSNTTESNINLEGHLCSIHSSTENEIVLQIRRIVGDFLWISLKKSVNPADNTWDGNYYHWGDGSGNSSVVDWITYSTATTNDDTAPPGVQNQLCYYQEDENIVDWIDSECTGAANIFSCCKFKIPVCSGVIGSDNTSCSSRGICLSDNNCDCISGYFGNNCETSEAAVVALLIFVVLFLLLLIIVALVLGVTILYFVRKSEFGSRYSRDSGFMAFEKWYRPMGKSKPVKKVTWKEVGTNIEEIRNSMKLGQELIDQVPKKKVPKKQRGHDGDMEVPFFPKKKVPKKKVPSRKKGPKKKLVKGKPPKMIRRSLTRESLLRRGPPKRKVPPPPPQLKKYQETYKKRKKAGFKHSYGQYFTTDDIETHSSAVFKSERKALETNFIIRKSRMLKKSNPNDGLMKQILDIRKSIRTGKLKILDDMIGDDSDNEIDTNIEAGEIIEEMEEIEDDDLGSAKPSDTGSVFDYKEDSEGSDMEEVVLRDDEKKTLYLTGENEKPNDTTVDDIWEDGKENDDNPLKGNIWERSKEKDNSDDEEEESKKSSIEDKKDESDEEENEVENESKIDEVLKSDDENEEPIEVEEKKDEEEDTKEEPIEIEEKSDEEEKSDNEEEKDDEDTEEKEEENEEITQENEEEGEIEEPEPELPQWRPKKRLPPRRKKKVNRMVSLPPMGRELIAPNFGPEENAPVDVTEKEMKKERTERVITHQRKASAFFENIKKGFNEKVLGRAEKPPIPKKKLTIKEWKEKYGIKDTKRRIRNPGKVIPMVDRRHEISIHDWMDVHYTDQLFDKSKQDDVKKFEKDCVDGKKKRIESYRKRLKRKISKVKFGEISKEV